MAFKAIFQFLGSDIIKVGCLTFVSMLILSGCNTKEIEKSNDKTTHPPVEKAIAAVVVKDSIDQSVSDGNPPESFVLDLMESATIIVLIDLRKIDSVRGTTKIFSGKVLRNYKGGLQIGSAISYAGMSEKTYGKEYRDSVVAFLTKHKKALLHLNRNNIHYSTVEDNAVLELYPKLDSLMKSMNR